MVGGGVDAAATSGHLGGARPPTLSPRVLDAAGRPGTEHEFVGQIRPLGRVTSGAILAVTADGPSARGHATAQVRLVWLRSPHVGLRVVLLVLRPLGRVALRGRVRR